MLEKDLFNRFILMSVTFSKLSLEDNKKYVKLRWLNPEVVVKDISMIISKDHVRFVEFQTKGEMWRNSRRKILIKSLSELTRLIKILSKAEGKTSIKLEFDLEGRTPRDLRRLQLLVNEAGLGYCLTCKSKCCIEISKECNNGKTANTRDEFRELMMRALYILCYGT